MDPTVARFMKQHCTDQKAVQRQLREVPINSDAGPGARRSKHAHEQHHLLRGTTQVSCRHAATLRDTDNHDPLQRGPAPLTSTTRRITALYQQQGATNPRNAAGSGNGLGMREKWNRSTKCDTTKFVDPLQKLLQSELKKRGYYDNYNEADQFDGFDWSEIGRLQTAADARYTTQKSAVQDKKLQILINDLKNRERAARNKLHDDAFQSIEKFFLGHERLLMAALLQDEMEQRARLRSAEALVRNDIYYDYDEGVAAYEALIEAELLREQRLLQELEAREQLLRELQKARESLEDREDRQRQAIENVEDRAWADVLEEALMSAMEAEDATKLRQALEQEEAERRRRELEEQLRREGAEAITKRFANERLELETFESDARSELELEEINARRPIPLLMEEEVARSHIISVEVQNLQILHNRARDSMDVIESQAVRRRAAEEERLAQLRKAEAELRTKAERSNKPFLGLALAERVDGGLIVDALYDDGPSYLAGISLNDQLIAVAGEPITTLTEMRNVVLSHAVMGKPLQMTIVRAADIDAAMEREVEAAASGELPDEEDEDALAPQPMDVEVQIMTSDKQFASLTDIYFDTSAHPRRTRESPTTKY